MRSILFVLISLISTLACSNEVTLIKCSTLGGALESVEVTSKNTVKLIFMDDQEKTFNIYRGDTKNLKKDFTNIVAILEGRFPYGSNGEISNAIMLTIDKEVKNVLLALNGSIYPLVGCQ